MYTSARVRRRTRICMPLPAIMSLLEIYSNGMYKYGLHSYCLCRYGLYGYGRNSYALRSYCLYRYGLHSYGLHSYELLSPAARSIHGSVPTAKHASFRRCDGASVGASIKKRLRAVAWVRECVFVCAHGTRVCMQSSVCPCVHVSMRPSVRPSVRPSFRACAHACKPYVCCMKAACKLCVCCVCAVHMLYVGCM